MALNANPYYKLMEKLSERSTSDISKVFSAIVDMALKRTNKEANRLYAKLKDPTLCKEDLEEVNKKYANLADRQSKLVSVYYKLKPL